MGGKSIRTRRLDRTDGAARRVGPGTGLDPKLLNEFCCSVCPSQVRDACGPHDGNEHTPRAIASDGVHSAQARGPVGLVGSFRPNAPLYRSARDSRRKFAPAHFQGSDCRWKLPTILRISIENQKLGSGTKWKSLPQLLDDPTCPSPKLCKAINLVP
jgi:hypothetical protein